MAHLWDENEPARFWQCKLEASPSEWLAAARDASPVLELEQPWDDFSALLALSLGEGRYGPDHWQLSWKKDMYYRVKPLLPRLLTRFLRQVLAVLDHSVHDAHWPIDDRYVLFQWELMRRLLTLQNQTTVPFIRFWPQQKQFALVLTHDIEMAKGQHYVRAVADLEESLGFRSSFNFVPQRYDLDLKLIDELLERGFEIGIHDFNHDGRLFSSPRIFAQRAPKINNYLEQFKATGFRAACTIREPEIMQGLQVEYDCSFFDTDPYEPIPGGTMSIWPFMLGHFVELPYTLVQDYTLTKVLKQSTPRIWLEKVEFIQRYHGMALLNSHPDYLLDETTWQVYHDFLVEMKKLEGDFWHPLPKDAAAWWRTRHMAYMADPPTLDAHLEVGQIVLNQQGIELC